VAHLHALGVMHRDIKPENFLLTDETDAANLKVPVSLLPFFWQLLNRIVAG
jgi:serine/threonine protein kinase